MFAIAAKYGGVSAGGENGLKGYQLTYMIAYIRDFCMMNGVVAESFETSCPWSNVSALCKNVKEAIHEAGLKHDIPYGQLWVSFRVTQLYETGAAVYVYFTVPYREFPDKVVEVYEDIEHRTREAVFANGGSISHHHGVGKLRKRFMERSFSGLNREMYNGIKQNIDPKNIFAVNNTVYQSEAEKEYDYKEKH